MIGDLGQRNLVIWPGWGVAVTVLILNAAQYIYINTGHVEDESQILFVTVKYRSMDRGMLHIAKLIWL